MSQILPLIQAIGPRIAIPSIFLGPKVVQQVKENRVSEAAKTIAFSFFIVSAIILFFKGDFLLSSIPAIAATSYYYLLKDPSTPVYRYIDWVLTTPLMLVALLNANSIHYLTTILIVFADIIMIACGYKGIISEDQTQQNIWFWLGMVAFLPIIYVLWNLKERRSAVLLTLIMWCLYPIVWYAKEQNLFDSTVETVSYATMDVIAKVGLVTLLKL